MRCDLLFLCFRRSLANAVKPWAARALKLYRRRRGRLGLQAAEDSTGIALENLPPVGIAQFGRVVDIALGVIKIEAGFWVDALDRADHLRGEQDVVDRHDFGKEIDA